MYARQCPGNNIYVPYVALAASLQHLNFNYQMPMKVGTSKQICRRRSQLGAVEAAERAETGSSVVIIERTLRLGVETSAASSGVAACANTTAAAASLEL